MLNPFFIYLYLFIRVQAPPEIVALELQLESCDGASHAQALQTAG